MSTFNFYNPRPATSILTQRTNFGFQAGHIPRTLPKVSQMAMWQPNALPLGEGFAPEIPAGVMNQMIGERLTGSAEATQPANRGNSNLQSTLVL